jgi:hypothetical protein
MSRPGRYPAPHIPHRQARDARKRKRQMVGGTAPIATRSPPIPTRSLHRSPAENRLPGWHRRVRGGCSRGASCSIMEAPGLCGSPSTPTFTHTRSRGAAATIAVRTFVSGSACPHSSHAPAPNLALRNTRQRNTQKLGLPSTSAPMRGSRTRAGAGCQTGTGQVAAAGPTTAARARTGQRSAWQIPGSMAQCLLPVTAARTNRFALR